MSKTWSISTTVRSPERLRAFLVALQPLVGKEWNRDSQKEYQKLLIKNRLYGYGSQQFYNGLPPNVVATINDVDAEITDTLIDRIIEAKNYQDSRCVVANQSTRSQSLALHLSIMVF